MRFLCLHGSGASGAIFAAQTASFRVQLQPGRHQFDFINGPYTSKAGPGIQHFFEGPYHTFLTSYDQSALENTYKWLEALFERQDKPYDAVIGFSQGVAVLAAYTIWHQMHRPEKPLPYKAAMLICGGMPFAALEAMGYPVSEKAWALNEKSNEQLYAAARNFDTILAGQQAPSSGSANPSPWFTSADGLQIKSEDKWTLPPLDLSDVFGLNLANLPDRFKIKIPTVHVYGAQDPRTPHALQLALMCDPDKRMTYDHQGGHEIPRSNEKSLDLAATVDWLEKQVHAAQERTSQR
ncbi:EF-hand calcium-binding domain-containing protein [Teratosphaeria destructans]|uniref:EF-hand calcium-binding domain-containing protein n=1 Tax=Teratosphaeria destructans TaxID=418781 RepID=A0A9W7SPP7_9PEZI|nr:EF-hand calcium-binding domain-containing protein [Teratosphaeria destructans]